MHYYPHHIGDFIKDTANLNNDQCMTYLRMCWRYYLDEKPITEECEDLAFALGTDEKTVRLLLKHYFHQCEDGWRHTRIDREISAYKNRSENARKSANARWKNANAMRTHSERNADAIENDANQEPRTKNQEDIVPNGTCGNSISTMKVNGCPYNKIVDLYHERLPMLPRITRLNDSRKRSMLARWKNELTDLETWEKYFSAISRSRFLTGKVDPIPPRTRPFMADIDFILRPGTLAKLEQGTYHR